MSRTHTMPGCKWCPHCSTEKKRNEFGIASKTRDGRQGWCKLCMKVRAKEWREEPAQRADEAKINKIKFDLGCALCQMEYVAPSLIFHHLDPSTKDAGVSRMLNRRRQWEPISKEIDKCICICGNCHKKVHANTLVILPEYA